MHLTRRGLLEGLVALTASTSLIVRPKTVPSPDAVVDAELVDDTGIGFHEGYRPSSRLDVFLKSRGIKPAHLARGSGYSRQHLLRVRMGRVEPTRACVLAIIAACQRLSRERVGVSDLFDLKGAR